MRMARRSVPHRRGERGAVLMAALISALLSSIASYLVLQLAIAQGRQAKFHREHVEARHAAEAGLVFAYEQLVNDSAYCGAPDPPPMGTLTVDVTVAPCGGLAPRTVSAKVIY